MRLTADETRQLGRNAWTGWLLLLLLVLFCSSAVAQTPEGDTDILTPNDTGLTTRLRGLYFYRAGSSASYFTQANPIDRGATGFTDARFNSDIATQTSATLVWNLPGPAAAISLVYTPTYNSSKSYPQWNRMNHIFRLNTRAGKPVKQFGRWAMDVSVSADASNIENFLFTPGQFSQAAATPATVQDLSSALGQQVLSNGDLASAMVGGAITDNPALLFYGARLFTAVAGVTLTYAYSPRTSIYISARGTRFQPLNTSVPGGLQGLQIGQLRTTTAGGTVGMGYALGPRTQISWTADTRRVFAGDGNLYLTTATASLSRMMGRSWFTEIRGGGGSIRPLGAGTGVRPQTLQFVAGGTIGRRFRSHTLLASVDRSVSDAFGVVAASNLSMLGAWRWSPLRSGWSVDTAFSRQTFQNNAAPSLRSWRAHAGLSRTINRQLMVYTQYVRAGYNGTFGLQAYSLTLDGVRVSLNWTPALNLLRR
jgi:hypothetical protein